MVVIRPCVDSTNFCEHKPHLEKCARVCCCCCCDTIRNRRQRMSMYLAAGRNNHLLFALHAFRCGIANVILYIVLEMLTAFVYSHMNNVRSNYNAKQNNQQQLKKNVFNGKKKHFRISDSMNTHT